MQNRFVGDIGDFGKYGMLRCMAGSGYRLGLNWYLTDDGNDSAGNLKDYLTTNDQCYTRCDEELYKQLYHIIYELKDRSVQSIEKSGLLPMDTVFYSKLLKSEKNYRSMWFEESLKQLSGCEILFLDPDNNILLNNSGTKYDSEGTKYTFPSEIESYYKQGHSLIVYNHSNRMPEDEYFKRFYFAKQNQVFKNAFLFVLKFNRMQVRYYLFIIQPSHGIEIKKQIDKMLMGPWGARWQRKRPHFEILHL